MTTLNALDLRKALCEKLGWTWKPAASGDGWAKPSGWHYPDGSFAWFSGRAIVETLPAYESDPAVSEPWFLEWCEKNEWFFTLRNDALDCKYSVHIFKQEDETPHFRVVGNTPSECRAKAVLAILRGAGEA